LGFSIIVPDLWIKYFSHWIIPPTIALIVTLLIGLVLMDGIFELDKSLVIIVKKLRLKIEIQKFLVWAFLIVCFISIIFELVQLFLSSGATSWLDPLIAIAGSIVGIILHIIGSKLLMKRVEFELERWEDNVL
jgi:VanZ family protein